MNSIKKFFSVLFLKKETMLYLISLVVAYIITLLLFSSLNKAYDSSLQDQFDQETGKLHHSYLILSYRYHYLTNPENWVSDDVVANNKRFDSEWNGLSTNPIKTDDFANIKNIMLYGDVVFGSFSDAKNGFFTPYLTNPSISLNGVMNSLDWKSLETTFGKDGVENIKLFFSEELSDHLDLLQTNNPPYIKRRYLNGSIQFITFWVAITGTLILFSFIGRISLEKKALNESVLSFDLPQEMERYSIGQLEETMLKLKDLQSGTYSRLREMLINTVSTFSWRGKEQAESTLNLEIQELRENLDSRFGLVKYFAWAVPSIGFIGTVIGIGNALGNAHNVIGQNAEYQTKGQIQVITGQLGIAFDTTLVSLLLSIVLVLLIHILTRREEHLIAGAVLRVKKDLLHRIAPLERANKLRRYNLLLESLKSHTSPRELQTEPFVNLKSHLEEELNQH